MGTSIRLRFCCCELSLVFILSLFLATNGVYQTCVSFNLFYLQTWLQDASSKVSVTFWVNRETEKRYRDKKCASNRNWSAQWVSNVKLELATSDCLDRWVDLTIGLILHHWLRHNIPSTWRSLVLFLDISYQGFKTIIGRVFSWITMSKATSILKAIRSIS